MLGRDVIKAAAAAGHDVVALGRAELDITDRDATIAAIGAAAPDCVINCAAFTDVDGAEQQGDLARAVNGDGAGHVAAAAAAAGAWVAAGLNRLRVRRREALARTSSRTRPHRGPSTAAQSLPGSEAVTAAAPGAHTIVRSSWLFGAHGRSFPGTILRLAGERDQLTVVDDQVGCPTFTGHLAVALVALAERRPLGIVHVAGAGQCSGTSSPRRSSTGPGSRVPWSPGTTAELGRPAPRPAYSVLGSERGGELPRLADWREGLDAFMDLVVVS